MSQPIDRYCLHCRRNHWHEVREDAKLGAEIAVCKECGMVELTDQELRKRGIDGKLTEGQKLAVERLSKLSGTIVSAT